MTDCPITDGVTFARYVIRDRVEAYLALGWRVVPVLRPAHHDSYSALMEYIGPGAPVEPAKAVEAVAP